MLSETGKTVELFTNKSECCGCAACMLICPKKAITMSCDEEGFLYPFIEHEKCIKCLQCLNVCAFKQK